MRRVGMVAASAGFLLYLAAASARADEPSRDAALGRIDFESANLPAANVELDLSQGMFENLFEIGDANRRRGVRPLGPYRLLRDCWWYRNSSRGYPLAH